MSQKHWTFTNIIRYIEEYERNPLLTCRTYVKIKL